MRKIIGGFLAILLLGIWWAATPAPTHAAATTQSVAFPMYEYPTIGNLWSDVYAAGPQVPWIIVNPANGPGASVDPTYTTYLNNKPSSQRAIGYVHIDYSTRPIADVLEDIDEWYVKYPQISGIFVDLLKNGGAVDDRCYAATVYNYIKSRHPNDLVVMNPGTNIEFSYERYGDIFMNAENTYANYVNWTPLTDGFENSAQYANRFMHIVHTTSSGQWADALSRTRANNAGWVLITDEDMPNPYMATPSYWLSFLSSVGNLPQTAIPNRGLTGMFAGCLDTSMTTSTTTSVQSEQTTTNVENTVHNLDSVRFVPGMSRLEYDLPTGATLSSVSGSGWTCSTSSKACTYAGNIAAGGSLPVVNASIKTDCSFTSAGHIINGVFTVTYKNFAGDSLAVPKALSQPSNCPVQAGSGGSGGSAATTSPKRVSASATTSQTSEPVTEETTTTLVPDDQPNTPPTLPENAHPIDSSESPETTAGPTVIFWWIGGLLLAVAAVGGVLWVVSRRRVL